MFSIGMRWYCELRGFARAALYFWSV